MAALLNTTRARMVPGETAAIRANGAPGWAWDLVLARRGTNPPPRLVLDRLPGPEGRPACHWELELPGISSWATTISEEDRDGSRQ